MLFAHESLRRPLLVSILAAGGIGSALAAPADQTFEDQTLGSKGNPVTINGITYFNNDIIPIAIVNNGDLANLVDDQALAFRSTTAGSSTEVGFKTADGSEFKLNSFAVSTGFGGTMNLTIKGYRDNTEVASTICDLTGTYFGTLNVAANTAWENIDEVRITGADLDIDIDDLDFSPAVAGNTAPVIGNLAGSVAWPGTSVSVKLDAGGDAAATDTQLGALNGGQGNWDGAVLRVRRKNNAVSQDDFGMDLPASYGGGGGQITHDGVTIANYSISGGTLTVTFTDVAKPVLTSYVNDVLRSVEYSNSQPAGDAVIEFSLSDGTLSGTADVTVTSDTIFVTNATDTATINPVNGTSFSEAVAIANADATGTQTIRFLSGFANSTLTLNAVTISGDVVVDFNDVNNLTLAGGNITVSAGATLELVRDVGNIAEIQNVITGAGNLLKVGTSRVTLSAASNYTGSTLIGDGELRVTGSLSGTSSLNVSSGAYLSGTGSVFAIGSSNTATFQSGSLLIPGSSGLGTLTINGNLSMSPGSTLWVDIQGTTAGSTYDQVVVNGSVNVTGAFVMVDHGYTPGNGDSHTIIDNNLADAVIGTFTGLAEGGTITADGNGTVLTASYIGGTGNDFTLTAPIAPVNTAPVIGNLDGDSLSWQTGTLALDVSGNATVSDAELGALNGGNGNWAGASLTVRRPGTALSMDVFGFDTTGNPFTVNGANLQAGGLTFATYTNTGGVLTVTFTSSGTAATTALVQNVLRRINYRNDTPAGDATVRFTLSDGTASTTADVTVNSDTIYVTNLTDTATINPANGVSFSEAVAIAAADATGSQTLVFSPAFSGIAMSLAGSLSINESLTLDASAANGLVISGGTTITLGAGTTLRITNEDDLFTIGSTFGGSGSLRKEGAGTLALSSVSNEANMSGGITVAGGTLQISTDDHLPSGTLTLDGGTLTNGTSSMTIDNAISLGAAGGTFDIGGGSGATPVALSGVISGSGTLTKSGQAILELSASNSYTGATSVSAGTLIASHANALGTTAGGTTVSSGATVRVAGALSLAESFNIAGTGRTVSAVDYGALHLVSASSMISGSIALDGDANVSAASGATFMLNGPVLGAFNLTKTDAGSLFLNNSGNSASHTGGTTLTSGNLAFASDANLGSGTLTLGGGTLVISGATTVDNAISLTATTNISTSANVTLSGVISGSGSLNKAGASTLTLSGTNNGTGGITLASGTLSIASDSNLPSGGLSIVGGTLAVTGATTIDNAIVTASNAIIQTSAATTISGDITGVGGMTKSGAATLTLTGANNYLGGTIVSAGTLVNNGSNALSFFTVQSGATLSGGGSGRDVTVQGGGTLAPGPGDFAVNGNLSMASGSTLAVDINGATAGTGYDQILVTGTVSLGAATLSVNHGYTPAAGAAYTIISNDASDSITGTFASLAEGTVFTAGGNATKLVPSYIGGTGNDFVLTLANTAPTVANAIPNQNATEDSAFNFQFAANTFADADSDTLTYTAQLAGGGSLPSWLSFDGLTRTFSGTPVNANVGTVSIDVIANDGNGGTVTDTFNITIANTNDDPIVANAIPNQNATEDSLFSFQFAANTFNDPDVGDTLTYSAQLNGGGLLPSWLSFNPANRTFSGTPLNGDVGTISIDVIADDGNGGTVTDTFNITVANTNDAPTVANPIPNRDAMRGQAFNFQFALNTFNDQDVGDTLTYSAQLNGGGPLPLWLSFDPVTRTFSGTPGADDLGTVSIDVTANDGNSGTVTDTFTITVKNSAPVVTSVDTLTEDGAYKAGDTVLVVVTFDQPVTYTGTPQLTLETGATDRVLNVTNGLPGNSIYFSYLIGAGETSADLDYVSTTALGLNGGSIRNSEDTVANIILPAPGTAGSLGANANIVIDTTAPVITSVVFTPGGYVQGNQIQVAVTFSEAVEVLNPDTPTTAVYGLTLTPDHGDDFAAATYLTPIGNTMALIATVPAGVADADGITPGTELVGGPPLADAAGNLLVLTLNNISGASGVLVDSIAPVVSTPIPDQPLVIGDAPVTIDLTQHFTDIGISPMVFVVLNNSDNTKASASITGNTLTLTGLANGVTDITIRADDNYGGFVVDTFQAAVGTSEPTAVQPVLSGTLNPQNGLFELTVNVTNTTPLPINGMRLHVDFSAYLAQHPSLRLYNATATTAPGIAHVDHPFPVAMNAVVPVKLSFYTTTRQFPEPFAPVLTVETLASSALPDTNGSGVQPRLVEMPDGNKLIEFPTEAGKWYRVRYSQDMVNWYDSPVPLQAGANRMQWIDSGPPFTQSPPSSVPSRFYIVNEITAP